MDRPEFSVRQFFIDGSDEVVCHHVYARTAVEMAYHYCNSVGAKFGFVERVIITDGGDNVVFEWKKGLGIVFPERLKTEEAHERSN